MPVDFPALHETPLAELRAKAVELGLEGTESSRRADLVFAVGQALGEKESQSFGRGVLEVHGEGFGFLRSPDANFLPGSADIYVSQSQIRRFKLQTGDTVIGVVRPPKEGERYLALLRVESVNGEPPGAEPPSFDTLTAIYPDDRLHLGESPQLQALDLAAPLGLGQRGLLHCPPRSGRVGLIRDLANAIASDEELQVTVLLIGERPEEIGEWRKNCKAEVVATPFDDPPSRHVAVADIVFERARRMVERGDDAVLIVDSLSRLLRFCASEVQPSGRLQHGIDTGALQRIRRYLGAARALEEGGSLTVIGVTSGRPTSEPEQALTGDLEEVVNWEVVLDPHLKALGLSPAIQLSRSGTLEQDRLLTDEERAERATFASELTGDPQSDLRALLAKVHS